MMLPLHEWDRWVWGWHGAFWCLASIALTWLVFEPGLVPGRRIAGLVAVGVLMVAYAVLVQSRSLHVGQSERWSFTAYLAVAVVVVGIVCCVDPNLTLLLFVVYPQAWVLSSNLRAGVVATVAVTVAELAGFMVRSGFTGESLLKVAPQTAAGLIFSVLMGLWIYRIIDQSVERAQLISELEAARAELARAERARGVTAERERLAREIHDTLAQGFTSVIMLSQAATAVLAKDPRRVEDRLAAIEEVARQNLAEARALVAAFSPIDLEGSTLPDALRRLTGRFATETGLPVGLDISDDVTRLDRGREIVLLRAVQESLTNVRRHAAAHQVSVTLGVGPAGVWIAVDDDGVGFSPGGTRTGYGLAGMRGRVAEVGGAVDVASEPGAGTRVTVSVPSAVPGRHGTGEDVGTRAGEGT
jgi:signal transduction histidine kinase